MKAVDPAMWSRSKELLALGAGILSHELKLSVRSRLTASAEKLASSEVTTRLAQAALVAESLGRLKGAFMKAGQLLSIDASELLPPEAQRLLSSLQSSAEAVDFAVMRQVLVEDLGEEKLAMFDALSAEASASASIGQVHRARVHGLQVAVKIQYPGIRESIDADLDLVHTLVKGWLSVSRRPIDLRETFEELKNILHLEADYARERGYLERFGELVADDPRFVVPQSLPRLSSSRVLTMTWEDGQALGAWIESAPPLAERERLAEALLDLYCKEFFAWGLVQTDPNFGNFLVREGAREIVLLDFGATVSYDQAFRDGYIGLLRVLARGDDSAIVRAGVENDLLDVREDEATQRLFVALMRVSFEPFARPGRFSFSDTDYSQRSREVVMRFTQKLRFSPPPRRLLFLHRKLGGLFQLFKRLDVSLDLRPCWDRMIRAQPSG